MWWAEYIGEKKCPMYVCCIDGKGFDHCGMCGDLPCGLFTSVKDPDMTDEEHEAGIRECVARLQKMSGE